MLGKSRVKYIQSLGQKKARDQDSVFIAEGQKLVTEWLDAGNVNIQEIYAVKDWIDQLKVVPGFPITEISDDELGKVSQLTTPNQVIAVVKKFAIPVIDTRDKVTLVLDTIQDPGNLGTIIRIADWFGVTQVVCSSDCVDMYNPKVVQATMGSLARVNVCYTDLHEWLSAQINIPVYAAMLEGDPVNNMEKLKEAIIIIGNESKGVSIPISSCVHKKITIPRKGRAESLNAAIATGIILSHIV